MKSILIGAFLIAAVFAHKKGIWPFSPNLSMKSASLTILQNAPAATEISFSDFADQGLYPHLGSYTVVEVWSQNCSRCRRLDVGIANLLKVRSDIHFNKVIHPSRVIGKEAFEKLESQRTSSNVCFTPHVLIYDGDGQLIAADSCSPKSTEGQQFLKHWIANETGLQIKI